MQLNTLLYSLPKHEIQQYGLDILTYGSLSKRGLETTVYKIKTHCKEPIYGFDLGCGDGELIWHFKQKLYDSEWEGVEISEYRVSQQTRDVCIWQGDMLDENFHVYNVLHADNLCLNEIIADMLEEKISQEFSGLYLSYRKPTNITFLRKAKLIEEVLTETTWGMHTIYYLYL